MEYNKEHNLTWSSHHCSFNEWIESYKKIYIPDLSAIDNQRSYLNRVHKNDKMTVLQFLERLKHINMLIAQFPGTTVADSFTPTEIKRIFYHSMPTRWRTNFINSGQSLQTTNVETLHTYMVQQESQTDAHRRKSRDSNGNKKPSKIPFNRFNRNSNKGNKKHTSSNVKQGKDQKNKKLTNDDDCPIHGSSHKWGQFHQNQYGENFRPWWPNSTNNNSSSSQRSHRSAIHNGLSTQVQVYSNEQRNFTTDLHTDNRSQYSGHSQASRNQPSYNSQTSYQDRQVNGNYNAQYLVECFNYEDENLIDYLPEGSVLIQTLNGKQADLYALCLFDSGSTNTLINQ